MPAMAASGPATDRSDSERRCARVCWDDAVRQRGSSDRDSSPDLLRQWLLSPAQVETGSTRLRVGRSVDGSWSIAEPGRNSALRQCTTRGHALAVATSTLSEARGGQVEVTEEDGTTHLVPVPKGKRPWWQVTRSPLAGLLLGLLWLGLFTLRAFSTSWPPGWGYETFALLVTGLCAAFYLWSTALLLRRRRVQRRPA